MSRTKDQFRELSHAEIMRQTTALNERRAVITGQLAEICKNSMRAGTFGGGVPLIDVTEEEKVRAIARQYLAGSAPAWLAEPIGDPKREQTLHRERRALDLALRILTDARVEVETAEALEYGAAHREVWCEMARQILISAITIYQVSARLREIAVRATGTALPCGAHFGATVEVSLAGTSLREILPDAVAGGLISQNEAASCAD